MAKTISFVKGKGNVNHNNREFVTENVDPDRIKDNITYVHQDLDSAFEEHFGDAIKAYDSKQTRNDRKYGSVEEYMVRLKHSKNGEKLFYENIVQIGDMKDSGTSTADGKVCAQILNEYALSFEKRNPNLKVFNMVLHLDEKTPHLHVDYIPVATGYSQGLGTRNSLSKALENQNFSNEKRNKYQNSLLSWQKSEREYLKELSLQYGIETTELGIKREDMELETFKAHEQLKDVKEELKIVTVKSDELKEQAEYFEERLADIDEIKYGTFAGKKAEEDNKALQYQNRKLKEENEKLVKENSELKSAAEYWHLLLVGIQTYKDEKLKKVTGMINKLISRGRDPLQVFIDEQKENEKQSPNPSSYRETNYTEENLFSREEH